MRCTATKQAAAANTKSSLLCGRMPTRISPFFEKPGAHTPGSCREASDSARSTNAPTPGCRELTNFQIVELKLELAGRLATRKEQRPEIAAVGVEVGKRGRGLDR